MVLLKERKEALSKTKCMLEFQILCDKVPVVCKYKMFLACWSFSDRLLGTVMPGLQSYMEEDGDGYLESQ